MDWNSSRSDCLAPGRYIHADNAAIGAIPKAAAQAGWQAIMGLLEEGTIADLDLNSGIESVRADLAGANSTSDSFEPYDQGDTRYQALRPAIKETQNA